MDIYKDDVSSANYCTRCRLPASLTSNDIDKHRLAGRGAAERS